MTKASIPTGQIATANGELATAVAEAFETAHQYYSADRVLADPALNEHFLKNCRLLGIPGEARDWNHLLLGVRKRGGLATIDTTRRTVVPRSQMEPYRFASEIAWRRISDENTCTLDDILCDPGLASQFDKFAKKIAPGFQSFDYRWAALAIRKDASKGKKFLALVKKSLPGHAFGLQETHKLPSSPAHYLITAGGLPFFVGYAPSLRECPLFDSKRLGSALETINHCSASERDIEIQMRKFDPAKIIKREGVTAPVLQRAAQRKKLVAHYEPAANMPSHQTAA